MFDFFFNSNIESLSYCGGLHDSMMVQILCNFSAHYEILQEKKSKQGGPKLEF